MNQLITLMQGDGSSLAFLAYHLLGTPQDRWTGQAWYGGAVLALKVVWSRSETSLENRIVLVLLFPLSPAQSGGFHTPKLERAREEHVEMTTAEENLKERGEEEDAIAVFHYWKGGFRQYRANSPY